jgi:hypothetical protein
MVFECCTKGRLAWVIGGFALMCICLPTGIWICTDTYRTIRKYPFEGIVLNTTCAQIPEGGPVADLCIAWDDVSGHRIQYYAGLPAGCVITMDIKSKCCCCENFVGRSVWFRCDGEGNIIDVSANDAYSSNIYVVLAVILFIFSLVGFCVCGMAIFSSGGYEKVN